jgi:hypothetical protein
MKRAISLIAVAAVTLTLPMLYLIHEHIESARSIAVLSDWGTNTAEREAALTALKTDKSAATTKALIAIVLSPQARPDTPEMVIPVLAARHDPAITQALSQLLQPHLAPVVRRVATDSLKQMDCGSACVENILHYEERIWKGDVPSESDVNQSEGAKGEFQNEENAINSDLDLVLQRNSSATMEQLRRVYGLGSLHPSYFALYVLQQLNLSEACTDLSRPYLREIANDEKRKAITAAFEHNKCESRH